MSDPICEIFPNDPVCAVEEAEPEVVADVEETTEGGEEADAGMEEGAEEGAEEKDAEPEMKKDFSEAAATAVNDWNRVFDMANFNMMSPMMANLSFLGVALTGTMSSALIAFRYRSKSTFYDALKTAGDKDEYTKLSD